MSHGDKAKVSVQSTQGMFFGVASSPFQLKFGTVLENL